MPCRALLPEDAEAFQSLRLRGLLECPEAFASSHEEEVTRSLSDIAIHLQASPERAVFGYFNGQSLQAVVGLQREAMHKLRHKAHIWGVYVAPEARHSGIALETMRAALAYARSVMSVRQVTLGVNTRNAPAVALYRKLGFEEFGLERGYLQLNGEFHDEHLMVYWVQSAA